MSNEHEEDISAGPPPEGTSRRMPETIEDLVDTIKATADKLAVDGSNRGELKLLSRTLRELRHAFKVFGGYRGRRKVTVFGSARTRPEEPPYQQAVAFGKAMAGADWLIITGAASGIMEAGHQGAGREHSMGLNIMLPFEQSSNPIIEGDTKLVHMKYFFNRKLMFVKECDAVACLPGGFGTLDEAFEVLTLLQTGKRDLIPVVLLDAPGGSYWRELQAFIEKSLRKEGLISPEDYSLYKITDNLQEAVDEILGFFRVYHSMRFVRERLVIRLNERPSDELVNEINVCFEDILLKGQIRVREALPQERRDDIAHLPRLVLHFNRRSLGRLRQLIDCLNQGKLTEDAKRLS